MRKILFFFTISFLFSLQSFASKQTVKSLISDTLDVIHYDLNLDIAFKFSNQLSGFTDVKIKSKMNNVNNITLELLMLSVDSVLVNSANNNFSYVANKIRIPMQNPLNTGDSVNIRVYYHGTPHVETYGWGGFHISSGLSYNLGISFGDDPHNYGKCFFPCVDDFVDRAYYDYHITVDSSKTVVCGGTLMSNINNGNGSRTFHWKLNNTIPAYLASVAEYNYLNVSGLYQGINGNIPTAVYVLATDTAKARTSFTNLNGILNAFEYYWGAYRWERVGYVATTLGAMEHACNIAYPAASIDGTLANEYLIAHELSHHWFGNLITCSTALDMWINEGWATYNEALYRERVYGKNSYKDYLRTKLKRVLQTAHIEDGAYRALYGIPSNYTYGETVYQKGSTVVQTLRGYLGDSLFFGAVKEMLNQYAFNDISTAEMKSFLSSFTGIDMTDFFNFYVYNPGFTHFSVDSVVAAGIPASYTVYVRQKLKAAPAFANKNRVEVSFMNNQWQKYTGLLEFDGETGNKTFQLPFNPTVAMLDMEEKIADATTDKYEIIKNTGIKDYPELNFQLDVQQITDSALVRVVHNWIKPDALKTANPEIKRLHPDRYWLIQGVFPSGFSTKGKFYYNRQPSVALDNKFLPSPSSCDSMVLLYRQYAGDDWHIVNFIKSGDNYSGYLITQNLQQGEYVLAISKPNQSGFNEIMPDRKTIEIFPNPASDEFTIKINNNKQYAKAEVFDSNGAKICNLKISENQIKWKPITEISGNYFLHVFDKNGNLSALEKLVYINK